MTTTVTVKACSWPVRVTTVDRYARELTCAGAMQRVTTETVEPFTERQFYITDTRSIAFDELPAPELVVIGIDLAGVEPTD